VNTLQTAAIASTFTTVTGTACTLIAGNEAAIPVVRFMTAAMGLSEYLWDESQACLESVSRLQIHVRNEPMDLLLPGTGRIYENGNSIVCCINPAADRDLLATQMIWLSPFFIQSIVFKGGALIHGALAERNGEGVIFAGPGGIGKTTVSKRLPHPWRSLSDDMTLIERDANGEYRAHPWPTWSRFMWGGEGGTWNIQDSVLLRAIFVLEPGEHTRIQETGTGQSVMMLQEVADQASFFAFDSIDRNRARRHQIERFDGLCAISQKVPTGILHASLNAPFADILSPFIDRIRAKP
jgi:SynChlorMet cassette protein ScmC